MTDLTVGIHTQTYTKTLVTKNWFELSTRRFRTIRWLVFTSRVHFVEQKTAKQMYNISVDNRKRDFIRDTNESFTSFWAKTCCETNHITFFNIINARSKLNGSSNNQVTVYTKKKKKNRTERYILFNGAKAFFKSEILE